MPVVFLCQIGVDPLVVGEFRVAAIECAEVPFQCRGEPFLFFPKLPASLTPVRDLLIEGHVLGGLMDSHGATMLHLNAIKGLVFVRFQAAPTPAQTALNISTANPGHLEKSASVVQNDLTPANIAVAA